jgi:hypothetical protein
MPGLISILKKKKNEEGKDGSEKEKEEDYIFTM